MAMDPSLFQDGIPRPSTAIVNQVHDQLSHPLQGQVIPNLHHLSLSWMHNVLLQPQLLHRDGIASMSRLAKDHATTLTMRDSVTLKPNSLTTDTSLSLYVQLQNIVMMRTKPMPQRIGAISPFLHEYRVPCHF